MRRITYPRVGIHGTGTIFMGSESVHINSNRDFRWVVFVSTFPFVWTGLTGLHGCAAGVPRHIKPALPRDGGRE